MSQFDRNSSSHLGARSKIKVAADSNSRKGKKKGQSSNNSWDNKKLWEAPTERSESSRNAGMDTWDNVPTNAWSDARNKKSSWEESMDRKKKELPTVWSSIEQEFPSLGDSQKESRRNVWTERQRKFEEVKILAPTSEAEEEKMIRIALEMSKYDVESEAAKRKRLEEEYKLQEEMLRANPDYFKDFVPEDVYVTSSTGDEAAGRNDHSSSNKMDDTWNDYSNFGAENNASSKNTTDSRSGWNDSSHRTAKSTLRSSANQKVSESVWGSEPTNSGNWNGHSNSGVKKSSSVKSTSNYNSLDSFDDLPLKTTSQSKTKTAAKTKEYDSIWGIESDNKSSDGWNDYTNSNDKKNKGDSSFISDNCWDDTASNPQDGWNDYSREKKNSTYKGTSSSKSESCWDDTTSNSQDDWNDKKNSAPKITSSSKNGKYRDASTDVSSKNYTKKSSKNYEECADVWGDDVDNKNDNAVARDKRNYSNFEANLNQKEKFASNDSKVIGEKNTNTSTKIVKSNTQAGSKGAKEDIKKVVDLFGGWGSASDFTKKPNAKSSDDVRIADENLANNHKNTIQQRVTDKLSLKPATTVVSQSNSELIKENSSTGSNDESIQISVEKLEKSTAEIKLSEDSKSNLESQNSFSISQIYSLPEESLGFKKTYLMADDNLAPLETSDALKLSDVSTPSSYNFSVHEPHKANLESSTQFHSGKNDDLSADSNSASYIHSPKPAAVPSESTGIPKRIESPVNAEYVGSLPPATHSSNLNELAVDETSLANQTNANKLENLVNNSPSASPPTNLPFESPMNPILPINPMMGGFMNPNITPGMSPNMMAGMNPGLMPGMNPGLMPGMNPMMMAGMNPLMQQMLFLSNPFLASQIRAMEMYYRSMGIAPQGMIHPQMSSSGFNGNAFPNMADNNSGNHTINAPIPPINCDIGPSVAPNVCDNDSPVINPPMYPTNSKLTFSLKDDVDTSSHILRYDPDDADSLLQQFLEPSGNDKSFIPPPVMPNARTENAVNQQMSTFIPETYSQSDSSSFADSAASRNIDNKNTYGANVANSESSWNRSASAKEPIAAVPESAGWGDLGSEGTKSNWNDEIDGWGNENYTMKAMGNPSRYDSKKRSVNRQPSSQPAFSRFKK